MIFNKKESLKQAQELADGFNEKEADQYASEHREEAWYSDFVTLLDLVRDPHFRIDSSTYLMIAGALAYVVFPIDVIPDFIPVVGYIDDVFVVSMVMKSLSDEVERYKRHCKKIAA